MNTVAIKTPGRNKSEEKARLILEAAGALFMREGFEAASMELIAREAGVSKQTVYSHYGSKEALFSAAIASRCEQYQLCGEDMDASRPPADYLREFAQHFCDLLTSEEGLAIHRICIAEGARSKVGELFWQAGPEPLFLHLHSYLTEQVKLGRLHIDNIDFAASQFLHMLKADAQMRGILGLDNSQELNELSGYIDSCINVFMRAYG